MPRAVFDRDFHYTSRRRNAGWSAKAGPGAQLFPGEFIDAALAAGAARVPPAPGAEALKQPVGGANHKEPER